MLLKAWHLTPGTIPWTRAKSLCNTVVHLMSLVSSSMYGHAIQSAIRATEHAHPRRDDLATGFAF